MRVNPMAILALMFRPFASKRAFGHNLLSIRGGSNQKEVDIDFFKVLDSRNVYDGKYRQIISKDVKFPNGETNTFEILSNHELPSVSLFVWHVKDKCCTLVKEYHPGPHGFLFGTVNGQYEENDGGKHTSAKECAHFELAEETGLEAKDENIISMLKDGTATPMDKYTDNRFYPFLVLDPKPVSEANARSPDDEEFIIVKDSLTYNDLMELIQEGKVNVVSTYTILLGFKTLEKLGIDYK